MSEIYIYDKNADDLDNMGLVGALMPTDCIHEEEANGMSEITLEHPYDEWGKWAAFENERILSVPVPVRTCPEIEGGQIVTSVEKWTVKATASKKERGVFTKQTNGRRKKTLKPGTVVTVVNKPADSDRYKIKAARVTGWIASAALEYDETEIIADDPGSIEAVQSPWSVKDQYFRIYSVTRSLDGVTVQARHIMYDMLGNVTTYSNAGSVPAQDALDGVIEGAYVDASEFEVYTDSADERTGV
ncbi:MAG: hypothetical protein Q4D04_15830, partial [Clostridia bacterium]|nr:hypothetical protein [Clostridia bacterium]